MDTKSDIVTVHIGTPPQSVQAKANGLDVANVYVGQPVSFTTQTTPPNFSGVNFDWSFGDGSTGQGAATVHAYSAAGDYSATVTARCANGLGVAVSDSVAVHVTVPPFPPIEADIVDEPPSGSAFTSGIDPMSIVLKLQGNIVTPSITPIANGFHIYYVPNANQVQSPGFYTVELEASDNAKGDGAVGNTVQSSWPYQVP